MNELLQTSIKASLEAGKAIMKIYRSKDFQIENKADDSPLTIADKQANAVINSYLEPLDIPIISEENAHSDFSERKSWDRCWIVDPLDGTKEFIKRNGEFTVNIALVEKGRPIFGVIYAPALEILYFAVVKEGKAYKVQASPSDTIEVVLKKMVAISPQTTSSPINVVGSRSHMNQETLDFIADLEKAKGHKVSVVSVGSSLKFCLMAQGEAHYYPRYAPTMEWDTAAGQAICEAVGLQVISRESGQPMRYNRKSLLNEHFLVSNEENFI